MSAAELFNPATVSPPVGACSHGAFVKAGSDLLFLAGQVGVRPDGGLPVSCADQADEVFANIVRILKAKDMTASNLVKITLYIVAGQALSDVRAARLRHLGDHKPASTLIFVPQLAEAKYLIEVDAVAAR